MAVERVGVSFEPELLKKFDDLIKAKGYTNRSEAIRDLIRKALIETEIEKGEAIGTLTIIYNTMKGILQINYYIYSITTMKKFSPQHMFM